MNRRSVLISGLGACAAMGIPSVLANESSKRQYIFVFAQGGWDPTRVFVDAFSNPFVSMEPGAQPSSQGNVSFVSHPQRPSVDQFFGNYHEKALICNGVQVRSIAHEICTRIAFTGGTSGSGADWATILGTEQAQEYTIPHMVLGGPSFSGSYGYNTVHTGNNAQLDELLSGEISLRNEVPLNALSVPVRQKIDSYLQQRYQARANNALYGVDAQLSQKMLSSAQAAEALKEQRYSMSFASGVGLGQQVDLAIEALSRGMTRCVSLVHQGVNNLGWDSHADNDATQSTLFESLFAGLVRLMTRLHSTRDSSGQLLSENTTIMVFSEMGRTAQLNATQGKDHWPYTSVLLWGEGFSSAGVVGAFDDLYQGVPIDPTTAEYASGGPVLSIESIGAALLAQGDVDPYAYFSDVTPLLGILR